MSEQEGVTKFECEFTQGSPLPPDKIHRINSWRTVFYLSNLIGADPKRYSGLGFGNISERLEPFEAPPHKRTFVISGTQTGSLPVLNENHYTTVKEFYWDKNRIVAEGPIRPSSEALTHGSIYSLSSNFRFVVHVHSPEIWKSAENLGLPYSAKKIPYGTPEMAQEVRRLFQESDLKEKRIFAMKGHEDGVLSFGETAEEACGVMLRTHAEVLNNNT